MPDPYRAFLALPEEKPAGIPLAVKDLIDTAGLVTTYGSAIFRDHVPERTASSVTLLEEAGYGIVGKTKLHEFAVEMQSKGDACLVEYTTEQYGHKATGIKEIVTF